MLLPRIMTLSGAFTPQFTLYSAPGKPELELCEPDLCFVLSVSMLVGSANLKGIRWDQELVFVCCFFALGISSASSSHFFPNLETRMLATQLRQAVPSHCSLQSSEPFSSAARLLALKGSAWSVSLGVSEGLGAPGFSML